jgi:aminoglycoside phosphotransferase (APT) family kinase protein
MSGDGPQTTGSVEVDRLQRWLSAHAPQISTPVRLVLISAGRSNLTYVLEDSSGEQFVLRRPPAGTLLATAHDVGREHRIISSLRDSGLPLPATVANCADPGVIGAPFFVMPFVAGTIVTDQTAARSLSDDVRQRVGTALATTLAQLHAVDLDQVGLGDLRRNRSYAKRQLRRWGGQIEGDESPHNESLRELGARLGEQIPASQREVLLHGDFKLENMILNPQGEVAAVLDWELASVGDPLADLAWLLIWWGEPGEDQPWINPRPTSVGGFGDRESITAEYARASALDVTDIDYYMAFSYWRLSCINVATRRRFLAGDMGNKVIDIGALDHQVTWQTQAAADLLSTHSVTS